MFWNLPNASTGHVDPVDAMPDAELAHLVRVKPALHAAASAELNGTNAAAPISIEPDARIVTIDGVEVKLTKSVRRVLALLQYGRWCDFSELRHSWPTMHKAYSRGIEQISEAAPRFGRALRVDWHGMRARAVCAVPVRFAGPIVALPVSAPPRIVGKTLLTAPPRPSLVPPIPPQGMEIVVAAFSRK